MRRFRFAVPVFLVLVACTASLAAHELLYTAELRGQNENPPTASAAWGTAFVVLDTDDGTLRYRVASTGFGDAPSAVVSGHIHVGGPTVNGGVRYPLTVNASGNGGGLIQLTPPEVVAFQKTEFYVNLHTAQNPAGAIRGQLTQHPGADSRYWAELKGANENPPRATPATGVAIVYADMDGSTPRLAYWITSTGFGDAPNAVVSSHIHTGGATANGPVAVPLPVDASGNGAGALTLTEAQKSTLLRNQLYVNLHTAQYPAGAIRGQLLFAPGPSVQYAYARNATSGTREFKKEWGPSIVDGEAVAKGELVDLLDAALVAGPPQVQVVPAFDPSQFPNGPPRAVAMTRPVTIAAGTPFLAAPGLVLSATALPDGISRPDFRNIYFQDYSVSINEFSVNQMAAVPYLFGPVVLSGQQILLPPFAPPVTVTAYNITFRIDTPGEYLVGLHWKTGRTAKDVEVGGGDMEAAEIGVVIPVTVTGSRPLPPYVVAPEQGGAQVETSARERLANAVREAVAAYSAGPAEGKSRRH